MDKERKEKTVRAQDTKPTAIIEGRNAVIEALRSGREHRQNFHPEGRDRQHASATSPPPPGPRGVVVVDADKRKLDCHEPHARPSGRHRAARACGSTSASRISLNAAREKGEAPLIVVCDEISDPHNLGAIIRTA